MATRFCSGCNSTFALTSKAFNIKDKKKGIFELRCKKCSDKEKKDMYAFVRDNEGEKDEVYPHKLKNSIIEIRFSRYAEYLCPGPCAEWKSIKHEYTPDKNNRLGIKYLCDTCRTANQGPNRKYATSYDDQLPSVCDPDLLKNVAEGANTAYDATKQKYAQLAIENGKNDDATKILEIGKIEIYDIWLDNRTDRGIWAPPCYKTNINNIQCVHCDTKGTIVLNVKVYKYKESPADYVMVKRGEGQPAELRDCFDRKRIEQGTGMLFDASDPRGWTLPKRGKEDCETGCVALYCKFCGFKDQIAFPFLDGYFFNQAGRDGTWKRTGQVTSAGHGRGLVKPLKPPPHAQLSLEIPIISNPGTFPFADILRLGGGYTLVPVPAGILLTGNGKGIKLVRAEDLIGIRAVDVPDCELASILAGGSFVSENETDISETFGDCHPCSRNDNNCKLEVQSVPPEVLHDTTTITAVVAEEFEGTTGDMLAIEEAVPEEVPTVVQEKWIIKNGSCVKPEIDTMAHYVHHHLPSPHRPVAGCEACLHEHFDPNYESDSDDSSKLSLLGYEPETPC